MADKVIYGKSLFTEHDVYLFKEGSHFRVYEKLGAHPGVVDGIQGTHFAVWAPNANSVFVIGDFNHWNTAEHELKMRWDNSGIWEGFIPLDLRGKMYKFKINTNYKGYSVEKSDPYGFFMENAPKTGSIVWELDYKWNDAEWMKERWKKNALNAPMSVYEVHLGSWKKNEKGDSLSYRELAEDLVPYVKNMGFTHVEMMPVMEHPFYGSWGYQTGCYYAPTSRFGTPQDFMYLVDAFHQAGIGVILDWVPSHFPTDEFGLNFFDGTHLYEHEDKRKGFHPDWKSSIFNYGRNEVKNFLISNALFWLEKYHADGLRVDAVASMLYLDYSRKHGEWEPNKFGGNENIEAIEFLKRFNETVYKEYPDVQTIAEESTAWPMVSKPIYTGGLGFGLKWNMGWMNDTLSYAALDPVYKKYHHNKLTFSIMYCFSENFMLPISHDEVVHGKGSLASKMAGDEWQRLANTRLLFGYMFGHPGKKMLFMGCEIGQWSEWDFNGSIDWAAGYHYTHDGVRKFLMDLNRVYKSEPALHKIDFSFEGFQWIDCSDHENSIISFVRKSGTPGEEIAIVCNYTPVPRENYRIGLPSEGYWKEILNSDSVYYAGSGWGNEGGVQAYSEPSHGFPASAWVKIPPLGVVYFKKQV